MSDLDRSRIPNIATANNPVPNWGRQVRTDFGTAAWNQRNADEICQTIPHHLVLLSFKPYVKRESRLGGARTRIVSAASGTCEIIPAGADYWARWHDSKEVAAFSLSESWLDQLAQDSFDRPAANVFADALPVVDRRVALLGGMLRDELQSDAGPKMADLQLGSILTLLGVHLLKQYGAAREQKDVGGLSDRQFRRLRDYLTVHLADDVKLDDMARLIEISSSQLLRSFRRHTGTTPHRYLTRMRLDRARALIVHGPLPLADVALTCGFSSQSHLTTVMRLEDGRTPGSLRM